MRWRSHTLVFLVTALLGFQTNRGLLAEVLTFDIPQPVIISDSGTPQISLNSATAPAIGSISSITVAVDHEWLGDLTIKLLPPGGPEIVLFDRPGVTASDPLGSSAVLGNFVPNSDPENPSFVLVPQSYQFAQTGSDFEAEATIAVTTQPLSVVPPTKIYAGKSWPSGPFSPGVWQLVITDSADLSGGQIAGAQVNYSPFAGSAGITWSPPTDILYGTPLGAAQLNASVTANGASVPGVFTYTPPTGTVLPAGPGQTLSVSFQPQDPLTFSTLTATVPINVGPAPLLITADDKGMNYGGPLPTLSATFTGFVNGDTSAALTQPISLTTSATATSPNGTYPIVLTGGASPNYTITLRNGNLTVGKAVLTITADDKSMAYGAALPPLTATYSGFNNGDTAASLGIAVTLQTLATPNSLPGSFPIIVTSGPVSNYVLSLRNGTLTVNKAPLNVTAQDNGKVYGAPLPAFTATYSGFVNGDTAANLTQPVSVFTSATAGSSAGSYPIRVTGGDSPKYTVVPRDGVLTVAKAQLIVTADNKSKAYGAPFPDFTATYSGFVNGDTVASLSQPVSLATAAGISRPTGDYPITVSGGASPNYALVYNSGTLTVTQAVLSVTADNKTKPYGAPLPDFTATYSGFVNGDTASSLSQPVSFVTTATASSPTGNYPLTVIGGASPNYVLAPKNGTLTVTKAILTITAENKTKAYGAALPAFTARYSGFVNGDSTAALTQPVSFATTATVSSPTGNYPIIVSGGDSPNYTMTPQNGTLTVTKALLIAAADDKTKAYGAPLPALTVTYTGFLNGDTVTALSQPVSLSSSATLSSSVGSYPISVSGGTSLNYTITLNPGTLTVAKAPLTVAADNQTKTYGSPVPSLTATYSGFVNGDTVLALSQPVSLSTSATANSPVGTYPINITPGASPNYSLNLSDGTLTVTKAPLMITANDARKVYGAALPVFTGIYSGFVNGDTEAVLGSTIAFGTVANAGSAVGTYPITVTGGASSSYALTMKNGTLTVNKAPLTITADNKVKVYGGPLPAFSLTYSGFVNGDTTASLMAPVSLTTTATAGSPVGAYPIRVAGGASLNYALQLNDGTLTVAKARLTVTADSKSKVYGAPLPGLTATYNGFVNGDTVANLAEPVSLATSATVSSFVGSYPINVTGGLSSNYSFAVKNGTLTVSKAPLTIRADDKTKAYGDALPVWTATYSGFVNGDAVSSLSPPVSFATTATVGSPVGRYPILATGAASPNYAITFLNGTLTITPAEQAIAFDARAVHVSPNGTVSVSVAVPVGSRVRLDWSDDLDHWSAISTQTSSGSLVEFNSGNLADFPVGFFRVVLLP